LGGPELLSEAQISIIRRCSAMECELEAMEGCISFGQTVDLDQYGRLCGRLARLFELIGIKRLARPVDPTSDLAKASKLMRKRPPMTTVTMAAMTSACPLRKRSIRQTAAQSRNNPFH